MLKNNSDHFISAKDYQQLKRNFKELKQIARLSAMREISSALGDQLNQPLTAIVSYTQAMQRLYQDNASSEEIMDAMERVVINAKYAAQIIQDIRNQVSFNTLKCQHTCVNQIIQDSLHMTELEHHARIQVNTVFDPDKTVVNLDPVQFKQVILNLLHNAIEALEDSDINNPEVTLMTRQDGLRYEIAILDNGPGISKDYLKQAFNPFFSTKNQAIGIGLSICQHIIDLHKGGIFISSPPVHREIYEHGTQVSIYLPRSLGNIND
jgi:C4-dicarboxylate-specific signal transduction histidine kinase